MSKILIHIHSGPDLKNKATLGMLVAVSAIKDGHDVSLFLAADGVHLLNCSETGKVVGEGTGDLKEHLDFLQSANTTLWFQGCPRNLGDTTRIYWKASTPSLLCQIAWLKLPWKQIQFSVIEFFLNFPKS